MLTPVSNRRFRNLVLARDPTVPREDGQKYNSIERAIDREFRRSGRGLTCE